MLSFIRPSDLVALGIRFLRLLWVRHVVLAVVYFSDFYGIVLFIGTFCWNSFTSVILLYWVLIVVGLSPVVVVVARWPVQVL